MRIDSSGERNTSAPSTGERKRTPASLSFLSFARLNTWKPPESVRIGRSQCMKRCSPRCAPMTSSPGRSHRWKVLPRIDLGAACDQLLGRHRLDGAVGADRHEGRRFDGAAGEAEPPAPRRAVHRQQFEIHRAALAATAGVTNIASP